MQTKILKVVKCGEMFSVKSEKSEGGQLNKRNLVLKELGGKYANEYLVSVNSCGDWYVVCSIPTEIILNEKNDMIPEETAHENLLSILSLLTSVSFEAVFPYALT